MQAMQQRMIEDEKNRGRDKEDGVEKVSTGITEFPQLPEWDAQEAPLKMGDWVTVLGPLVADMSDTADEWWALMLREVNSWYQEYLALSPLDRAGHLPEPPTTLKNPRWRRLERRVAGLMVKALPDAQREEMISRKCLTTFGILTTLQVSYQPGGLGEKRTLLKNPEEPQEAGSAGEAVTILRKWLRWRHRANEIHATEPDPAVLMKGLTRLVQKVLDSHQELRFRISLARSTLLVDSTPNKDSVTRYATHLLAELEQVAYTERKGSVKKEAPKIKRVEEDSKGVGKGIYDHKTKEGAKKDEDGVTKPPCRFFTSENGCKKGRNCKWLHIPDEKKRCFQCGSTKHFSPNCPVSNDQPGAKVKSVTKEENEATSTKADGSDSRADRRTEDASEGPMKSLIEEASRMLKALSKKNEAAAGGAPSLEELQRQLDQLRSKQPSMKTLRLTRMSTSRDGAWALLDSGATHPLRSLQTTDCLNTLKEVTVNLANGHSVGMLMTPSGGCGGYSSAGMAHIAGL